MPFGVAGGDGDGAGAEAGAGAGPGAGAVAVWSCWSSGHVQFMKRLCIGRGLIFETHLDLDDCRNGGNCGNCGLLLLLSV